MMIVFDNIVFSIQRAGGISVVWYELLRRMLEDNRFECQFLEYAQCEKNIFRQMLDIPFSSHLSTSIQLPIAIQTRLLPHIHFKKKTLFHSSYYRVSKDKNACNITTVHDFIYEKYIDCLRRTVHVWQKSRAVRNSQAIICISENTRNDLLSYYPDIDPQKVFVVYNGVSDDFCIDCSSNADLPFASGSYVLFVGMRQGYKGFLPTIQTLKNSGLNLVIVGGPELSEEEIAVLNTAIGTGHYVHLRGVSNSKLNLLYNNALVFLYPSAYEGFGIPIVEAQKAGCPVICRDTAISHEIASDGAMFFNDFTEIPNLIGKVDGVKSLLITAGQKNARRFSWDKMYRETTDIYLRLMGM